MKLSKAFLTILAPVATVSTVVPVVSCGNSLDIKLGDSVNCLSKKKPYKNIAKYYSRDKIKSVSAQNCEWAQVGSSMSIETINNPKTKTFKQVYFDFICSLHLARKVFCIESKWNENKFDNLTVYYRELDDEDKPTGEVITKSSSNVTLDNFAYIKGEDNKVHLTLNASGCEFDLNSHSYQEVTIIE